MFQVTLYSIYVSQMAFTAKISDPAVGGTYMTLLNTITNLGKSLCFITTGNIQIHSLSAVSMD